MTRTFHNATVILPDCRDIGRHDSNTADLLQCRLHSLSLDPATLESAVMRQGDELARMLSE